MSMTIFLLQAAVAMIGAGQVEGNATAISGDTLAIKGKVFKLSGISAPKGNQYCKDGNGKPYPCGVRSLDSLAEMIRDRTVNCGGGGRAIVCSINGKSLADQQVSAGWAVPSRGNRSRTIASLGAEAQTQKRGMWNGSFIHPQEWETAVKTHPPFRN